MAAWAVEVKIGHATGQCTAARCVGYHCAHIPREWERVGWAAECAEHEEFQPDVAPTRQAAREQAWAHNRDEHSTQTGAPDA